MVGKDFSSQSGFVTKAIHCSPASKSLGDPVITPIVTSTIYQYDSVHNDKDFEYTRVGNPTRSALEACLAALDNGKYGLAFASGQGATTSITHLLNPRDHLLVSKDLYYGTEGSMTSLRQSRDIDVEFFDAGNPDSLRRALKPNTAMIWLESPTNPHLVVVDIKTLSDIAHKHNKKVIIVLVHIPCL
ncbi:probable cystathionine gamma-synthase [Lutzomyia longipalpis]|uniref:probable cystathionine gamma-synthase n=1 Tax=Lutzomyia longipalpis TaxID=7200 RepID=UPI002483B9BC|nr:probable cystathionine gamma-synthase [Lutzomyia longipalpis]